MARSALIVGGSQTNLIGICQGTVRGIIRGRRLDPRGRGRQRSG
ncbi:hypothetical protein [Limosilactobacillus reuteri]